MKNQTNELRFEDLKKGDIILCPPNDWVGKAIVALTKGIVSHSAIYCGIITGKPTIAHAHEHGIVYNTVEELFTKYKEKKCYVKRNPNLKSELDIVINAADKFIVEKNPYSFGNLILLSLLVINGKMSTKIFHSRTFYYFLESLVLKMMKKVNKLVHKGKHPMTCSQFVSQCYTNEDSYIIQFSKLFVDFEMFQSNHNTTSLIELIASNEGFHVDDICMPDSSEEWHDETVKRFCDLLEGQENEEVLESGIPLEKTLKLGAKLIELVSEIHPMPNAFATNMLSKVIDMSPSDRNFYVTPDDLNDNTIDFVSIGEFTEKILK